MSKKIKEMIGGCCVCSDERGWNENPLVYCDGAGCSVAVHQACYGIVKVPTGPWFCKKCESQERVARVKCELCPQRAGALKRTDTGGWCHVVCALYIPEAWFADVQTMEPIVLSSVPHERFNKICYICEEQKKDTKATAGACMQCNRNSCKQYFHVTCAQAQGLLCEVTGSHENVKYCGYCSHHYKKWKNHSNVKTIPAFKPIPNENGTPDSSPEKLGPIKTEENKPSSKLNVEDVKSPQVDQSVSSTSDTLPSSQGSNYTGVEAGGGQVSDITSAVSPSAEDIKSPLSSSDHGQEPSSSASVLLAKSPSLSKLLQEGGSATSSTEISELDNAMGGIRVAQPEEEIAQPFPKRHRNKVQKSEKSKKTKQGAISSSGQHRKDNKRGPKKQREHTATKGSPKNSPAPAAAVSSTAASSLPGHHDYCGSMFGGGSYFPNLSGRSSTTSTLSTSFMGDNYLFGSDEYYDADTSNSSVPLIHPPKFFPSMQPSKQNQDRSHDFPLSMEQLLEQQWEQGAQFLMEQGHHFDISSLLNCLHRLKTENCSLEDQVKELTSRRNHLVGVNSRLAQPYSQWEANLATSQSSSVGSIEDISSPEEVQTTTRLTPPSTLPNVHIPTNPDYMVEEILSPVEMEEQRPQGPGRKSSLTYSDQVFTPQPLMYSVVNPPPPSLSLMSPVVFNAPSLLPSSASYKVSSLSGLTNATPLMTTKVQETLDGQTH